MCTFAAAAVYVSNTKLLKNVSSILLNLSHKELKQFSKRGLNPTSMVYLIKWPVSECPLKTDGTQTQLKHAQIHYENHALQACNGMTVNCDQ